MNALRTSHRAKVLAYVVGGAFLVALVALTLWPIAGSFLPPPRLNATDDVHVDRLLYAIDVEDLPSVKSLLNDRRANVNGRDRQGDTPLIHAARSGWVNGCQLLLEHGADARAIDFAGDTALSCAARGPRDAARVIELLLKHGAKVNGEGGKVPIIQATFARRADMIELLIEAGADVNTAEANGWTALHWAAAAPDADLVRLLVARGANVRATDDHGRTPLDVARSYGNEEAERYLRSDVGGS